MSIHFPLLSPDRSKIDYAKFINFFSEHVFGEDKQILEYFHVLHIYDKFNILLKLININPTNRLLLYESIPILYYCQDEEYIEELLSRLLHEKSIDENDIFFLTFRLRTRHNDISNFYERDKPVFICFSKNYIDLISKKIENPPRNPSCETFVDIVESFLLSH